MELLILLVIITASVYLAFCKHKKVEVPADPLEKLVRPEVIEDTSHLKADLARAKEELGKAFIELGQARNQFGIVSNENAKLSSSVAALQAAYDKVVSQKKSGEVRLGHVSEQLIPMLPEFPVPIETLKFFGNPIDYISIDMDAEMISFIEVKSGGSALSDKQKKIRKMVQDKRIQFFEVRIDDKGVKVK